MLYLGLLREWLLLHETNHSYVATTVYTSNKLRCNSQARREIFNTRVVNYYYYLLLHDLYRANFENRVRGAGVAKWRTRLTGEGEKVGF